MSSSPREDGFIRIGDFVFSFDRDDLTEEYRELAARELRETPQVREDALKTLKQLVTAEKGLYFPPHRDDVHLIFLRATAFYPEEAMKLIKKYCTFKVNHPSIYANLIPSTQPNAFVTGVVGGVPRRDKHGRRVLLMNGGAQWNPNTCSVYEFIRGVVLLVMMASLEPKTQVAGGAAIIDLEGMGPTQVLQFSPRLANSVLTLVQECMPIHLHAVHIVNQPYIFDMVFAIFKPFIGQKLRNMLQFHGSDREKLIDDIGAKNLPVKYGGELELPDIPGSAVHELLCHYEQDYIDLLPFGYTKKPSLQKEEGFQTID